MAYNSWTERVVVRLGTGQCGFGRAPLAVVEQTNVLPAESYRCPSDKSTPRASSSEFGTEPFRFAGRAGVFGRRVEVSSLVASSGSWPSPVPRRELRGPGLRTRALGRLANPPAPSGARWEGAGSAPARGRAALLRRAAGPERPPSRPR
jgi:hypothetical protein